MKGTFLVLLVLVGIHQGTLQSVTSSERRFMKLCVQLGCKEKEARMLCSKFAQTFKNTIYAPVVQEFKTKKHVETPPPSEAFFIVVATGIPFLIGTEQLDLFTNTLTHNLRKFYEQSPLPWKRHDVVRTNLGLLKQIALQCVGAWLSNEFVLNAGNGTFENIGYDRERFLTSIEKNMLQPRGQDYALTTIDDDWMYLVDPYPYHTLFSNAPKEFIDGDNAMSDEKNDEAMDSDEE